MEVVEGEQTRDLDETSTSSSASSSTTDLEPQIREQFNILANTLKETNQNMHTFEFMLGQYKKLAIARIAPFQSGDHPANEMVVSNESNQQILQELKLLQQTIESRSSEESKRDKGGLQKEEQLLAEIRDLRSHISQFDEKKESTAFLKGKIVELEKQVENKKFLINGLQEANGRLTNDLANERERVKELDRKLDSEKKAAQTISKDIRKYVDHVKSLEAENKELRKEAKTNNTSYDNNPINVLERSVLCQTCLNDTAEDAIENGAGKVGNLAQELAARNEDLIKELNKEKSERLRLEMEVKGYQVQLGKVITAEIQPFEQSPSLSTIHDSSHSRSGGKGSRTKLKIELAEAVAERNSLKNENERMHADLDSTNLRLKEVEASHLRLKSKSKILLKQYRSKKDNVGNVRGKLSAVKKALFELKDLCKTREDNNRSLLNHFGNQIEISARLLAAYLNITYAGPSLILTREKKLTDWFCNVQALSVWTQKQLVSFGKYLWKTTASSSANSDNELHISKLLKQLKQNGKKSKDIADDLMEDTLSEISHTLEKDLTSIPEDFSEAAALPEAEHSILPLDLKRALQSQDLIDRQSQINMDAIQDVIDNEDDDLI